MNALSGGWRCEKEGRGEENKWLQEGFNCWRRARERWSVRDIKVILRNEMWPSSNHRFCSWNKTLFHMAAVSIRLIFRFIKRNFKIPSEKHLLNFLKLKNCNTFSEYRVFKKLQNHLYNFFSFTRYNPYGLDCGRQYFKSKKRYQCPNPHLTYPDGFERKIIQQRVTRKKKLNMEVQHKRATLVFWKAQGLNFEAGHFSLGF